MVKDLPRFVADALVVRVESKSRGRATGGSTNTPAPHPLSGTALVAGVAASRVRSARCDGRYEARQRGCPAPVPQMTTASKSKLTEIETAPLLPRLPQRGPNEDVVTIGDGSRIGQGDECVGDGEADRDCPGADDHNEAGQRVDPGVIAIDVAYDPAEEDGHERPRAGDEWPARQGGAQRASRPAPPPPDQFRAPL